VIFKNNKSDESCIERARFYRVHVHDVEDRDAGVGGPAKGQAYACAWAAVVSVPLRTLAVTTSLEQI